MVVLVGVPHRSLPHRGCLSRLTPDPLLCSASISLCGGPGCVRVDSGGG